MTAALFRAEAIARHRECLEGALIISHPLSQRLLAAGLTIFTALVLILLATNSYQRKVTVTGALQPVAGLIEVSSPQSGQIAELFVEIDQRVEAGQPLLALTSEHTLEGGKKTEAELLASLQQQELGIQQKLNLLESVADATREEYSKRILEADNLIRDGESARVRQQMLLALRLKQNQRGEELGKRGLLAQADLENLQGQWLTQLQVVADIQARQGAAIANRDYLEIEQKKQRLRYLQEQNDLQTQLAQTRQQQAQAQVESRRIITAPVAGRITMIQSRDGISVKPQQVLLGLWPKTSPLQLELQVPPHAMGFIKPGQRVNLRVDAFPWQKFGVQHATVNQLGSSLEWSQVNGGHPFYKLAAELDKQSITAYGKEQRLLPGMGVSAEIRLDQRSLLEWALEPLYSLKGY